MRVEIIEEYSNNIEELLNKSDCNAQELACIIEIVKTSFLMGVVSKLYSLEVTK